MARISFGALPCRKRKLDDSSRLDVVEIARILNMLPSLFPSWSGEGHINTPVLLEICSVIRLKIVAIIIGNVHSENMKECYYKDCTLRPTE